MDGGPIPPPGWDKDSQVVQCPGRPVRTPPSHLEEGDGRKKNEVTFTSSQSGRMSP